MAQPHVGYLSSTPRPGGRPVPWPIEPRITPVLGPLLGPAAALGLLGQQLAGGGTPRPPRIRRPGITRVSPVGPDHRLLRQARLSGPAAISRSALIYSGCSLPFASARPKRSIAGSPAGAAKRSGRPVRRGRAAAPTARTTRSLAARAVQLPVDLDQGGVTCLGHLGPARRRTLPPVGQLGQLRIQSLALLHVPGHLIQAASASPSSAECPCAASRARAQAGRWPGRAPAVGSRSAIQGRCIRGPRT